MLATAGALALSASPAQAAPACPATDSGFLIGASQAGAEGVNTGTLTGTTDGGQYHVTCHYRGRHWVAPTGGSLTYVGDCYWNKEWYLIGGWTGRRNLSCP
ncbi:hypothetical protein [Phytohabitans houttuyneae]|jgi:hypothetical protein|uniref:SH3 domain-containing protein n=1 Tax=Phytohabitans houttuyneae TaxID=1076126 RepID=A0A6V8KJY0_9ACTN|nr:hypothetical protein [Phytohabitans houttuyneae]GFJ80985.1 hypothetical protein Phou_051650 [Phytohabitans houttuyneae]